MARRYVDFDAAWEAIAPTQAAPVVKIMGADVQLPADKPVALVLLKHQLNDPDERDKVGLDQVARVLRIVVGDHVVQAWIDGGMGKGKLMGALYLLDAAWHAPVEEEDGPGEAQPPATGEPSSTTS